MGLRTAALISSSNAADMAPALTETLSQPNHTSSVTAALPRPGILNNNGEYFCAIPARNIISKDAFQIAFGQKLSNGPNNGSLAVSHMDHTDDILYSETTPTKVDSNQSLQSFPIVTSANNNTPTNSNNMGLQKDYLKDNAEMEQMLGDLASGSDIDLLQVFKSFESAPPGDNLCELAGGLALFNDVDVINMGLEYTLTPNKESDNQDIRNEIEKRQAQMIRKCDFLVRRLKKVQARYMGQHINEEVNGLFDYTQQLLKRKERESKSISTLTPIQVHNEKQKQMPLCSMKNLIKRIDQVATSQQCSIKNKVGRQAIESSNNLSPKAFSVPLTNIIPTFDADSTQQLERTSGLLKSALKTVANAIDSDATASSSGGESADEMVTYNNQTQKQMTIAKRAAWRWARDRAGIVSRWTWLLAQISDLEYRVRQHNELHHQIKKNKGAVTFEDESAQQEPPPQQSVNGYRGVLPGNSKTTNTDASPNGVFDADTSYGSCRTRAFQRTGFRKRKLIQTTNLHTVSKKAARQSTVKCGCQWPLHPCALCTGRQDPTAPRDLPDMIPSNERVGLLDPGYHPVISFDEDVSHSVHFEAAMRLPEWQTKAMRSTSKAALKGALALQKAIERDNRSKKIFDRPPKKYTKKYNLVASKLKKKAKKSKMNRSYAYMLNNKHRKKSLNLTAPPSTSAANNGTIQYDIDLAANGSLPSRFKNPSPTPASGSGYKHERYGHYSDRKNKNSYDIDNIVIPYSVAASTRVEILPYKEIPTPKWRVIEDDDIHEENTETTSQNEEKEDQVENVAPDTIVARHDRALADERKKFSTFLKFPWSTRSRANRRIDSMADSSGANTPDPTSPAPKTPSVSGDQESIPSPAAPSTPQNPLEVVDSATELITTPIAVNTMPSVSSNGNIIAPSSVKLERRRTLSVRKPGEIKDDIYRRSNTPDIKEVCCGIHINSTNANIV